MDKDSGSGEELLRASSQQPHDYLLTGEVAALLRTPESTVRYWRHVRVGPPSLKLGRRVLYRRQAVEAWLREREAGAISGAVHHQPADGPPPTAPRPSRGRQRRAL